MRNLITGGISNSDYEVFLKQETKKKVAAKTVNTVITSGKILVLDGAFPQKSPEEFAQMRINDPSQSELAEMIKYANALNAHVKKHGEVKF